MYRPLRDAAYTRAVAAPPGSPLPRSVAITYSLPSAGVGFALFMGSIFFFKYATDVLGIAAAAMGWILFASRFWDALSDPIVGFLTDRTRTRFGRRRPWMIASALPLGLIVGELPRTALFDCLPQVRDALLRLGDGLLEFLDLPGSGLGVL